jgi:hypothetical protein
MYRMVRHIGFFVHQWNVRVKDLAQFSYVSHLLTPSSMGKILTDECPQILFIAYCLYGVVIACIKVAILLEWIRFFDPRLT